MKILFAGDIHGSAYYCEKLLKLVDTLCPDKIVLTGDLLYHGPRNDLPEGYAPKKVIEMLSERAESIICVRGNCEAEVDQMVLDFPCLADYMILHIDGKTFFVTHGHIYNKESLPKFAKGSVLVNGHTHVPAFEKYDDFTYVNVGSVSIPKIYSEKTGKCSEHSCVLLENNTLKFYTLDGEVYNEGRLD